MTSSTYPFNAIVDESVVTRPLPRRAYVDDDVFHSDVAQVFRRGWLFAAPTVELREAGSFVTFDVAGEPVLLVRDERGELHALANVCRHRGSRLCAAHQGRVKRLVCPYHQWSYQLDGSLAHARRMPDIDASAHGLHRYATREVGGLIFVALSDDVEDFEPVARDFGPALAAYGLDRTTIVRREEHVVAANWKLVVENSRECYHCGLGHPEYCRVMAGASLRAEPGLAAHAAACHNRWAQLGLPPTDVPFDDGVSWHHVVRMPLKEGSISQTMDGQRSAPLLGTLPSEDVGVLAAVTYPNFWLEASCDYAFVMRLLPRSATESVVQLSWLVHEDAVEGVDYHADRVAEVWAVTNAQDRRLCEENHLGVASPAYVPGPYGPDEVELAKFVHWYLRRTGSLAAAA